MNQLGAFVQSQDVKEIKWTLFRVPILKDGEKKEVKATFPGMGGDGMFLNRKSLAAWVVREMGGGSKWIGKAPVVSD